MYLNLEEDLDSSYSNFEFLSLSLSFFSLSLGISNPKASRKFSCLQINFPFLLWFFLKHQIKKAHVRITNLVIYFKAKFQFSCIFKFLQFILKHPLQTDLYQICHTTATFFQGIETGSLPLVVFSSSPIPSEHHFWVTRSGTVY